MDPIILCHLGVGSKPIKNENKLRRLVELAIKAVDSGYQILNSNVQRPALKAVEVTVNILEESGLTNSGIGAVRQSDGVQRCDASIMYGTTLSCGCVSSLEGIKYPISVARKLLEYSEFFNSQPEKFRWHFYFCGYFIQKIFELHDDTIPDSWRHNVLERENGQQFTGMPDNNGETVGAVAIDSNGNLAAVTSTGGLRGAYPGRIGDTAIIGA
ncbi:MAG: isoaspartyl peptidase/L-asparaginase, partial [Promethearchaeota archaeon]